MIGVRSNRVNTFYPETEHILRLKVIFESVYTSVFLIKAEKKAFLVDCATTPWDVDEVICPALAEEGFALSDIDALVVTHGHSDHAGGLARIKELAPGIRVVREPCSLTDKICTYPLPGHTEDMLGVLDSRTGTLISGDGLQGAGVDVYRCYLEEPRLYEKTLAAIAHDERIQSILFSHAYEPWYENHISGRENVLDCLKTCMQYI